MIEFKKTSNEEYEVYLNNVKTKYTIYNWKKDMNCYAVNNGKDIISGIQFLADAKNYVCIELLKNSIKESKEE